MDGKVKKKTAKQKKAALAPDIQGGHQQPKRPVTRDQVEKIAVGDGKGKNKPKNSSENASLLAKVAADRKTKIKSGKENEDKSKVKAKVPNKKKTLKS